LEQINENILFDENTNDVNQINSNTAPELNILSNSLNPTIKNSYILDNLLIDPKIYPDM